MASVKNIEFELAARPRILTQKHRNQIGRTLIRVPYTLGHDYIWGLHQASLNNLDDWPKRLAARRKSKL